MAKKAVKKKAAPKKAAAKKKTKKFIKNLDGMNDAEVCKTYKRIVKKPLHDHKRDELIKQIREVCKAKDIAEQSQSSALTVIKKGKKQKQKFQTVNWTFNNKFTKDEILQKAEQLASARIECNALDEEKKTVASDYKAKIDAKQAEINMLAGHIQHGFEKLTKACQMHKNFDTGFKVFYYEGKEVGQEKLTARDYQLQAEFEETGEDKSNDPE